MGLKSIILTRNTITGADGKETVEERYFISSLPTEIEETARAVRGHWMIESYHWHLDVTFREDGNHTLEKQAAYNLNIIRKLALNILKISEVGRCPMSMKKKRYAIGTNPEKYLDMECNINKTAGKWLVCAFMLLYPFSDMVSAGWIATTVNYLWPLLGLLYIALLLQKLAQKGHVHWYEGAGGVVSCIFCSSQEQVAAILLVLLFLAMVYSWRRKKSGSLWIYGYAVIDVISLFTILRCPGNGIRSMQEVEGRMPEFAYFSVWEKIYMGAANIERIFVAQVNSIFLIVSAVLAVLVGLKTKNLIKTLLSSVPVFCILGYALIRTGHPWYEKIFIIPKQTAEWNFKDPANWFPVIFLIVTVAGMSYALFCLMKEKLETYFYTIAILGVGLASGIVMGFSPTIYASADRPYIYLYFILMAVCLFCIRQMRGQIRKEVPVLVLNMSAVILGLFCMVNIAETLWMCHIM